MSFSQPELPPASGRRLSRLLGRWAAARRLDDLRAAAIRQAIVTTPPDLGFDWWWRLLDPEHGSVFRAAATWSAPAVTPGWPVSPAPFTLDVPGLAVWPHTEAEYQPYLRLV